MANIKVKAIIDEYWEVEPNPDDRWDCGQGNANIYIQGISVVDEKGYKDITVGFDVEKDRKYYLLWAKYGTGDSFGSNGGNLEPIDLFINKELAEIAMSKFKEERKEFDPVKYIREGMNQIQYSPPWDGYFEWLDYVSVTEVKVIEDDE